MELKDLQSVVLILVITGMLIGIGMITFDKFGDAAKVSSDVLNESFTMPSVQANVTLSNGNITSGMVIRNATGTVFNQTNITVYSTEGILQNYYNEVDGTCNATDTCYAWYTYDDYDTATRDAMYDTSNAIEAISSDWMTLIVTIVVLAIILQLVITSFAGYGRRD